MPKAAVSTALSRYVSEDAKTTLGDFVAEYAWVIIAVIGAILLVTLVLMQQLVRKGHKDASLIRATETDELTGLYNRDYFLEYAGQMQREHPDKPMDAVVVNIDRFHAVNAMNGREFGDQILRALGNEIHEAALDAGGIAGRFEADRFDLF